jgi:hypothetical protein
MSGLIWANVGKSISDIGATYGKQGFQMELMRMEEEKALRLDEIKRSRDLRDVPLKAKAEADAAPIRAQGEAAAAPIRAQAEADAAPIKAAGEAKGLITKAQTPGYLEAKQQEADAGESTSVKDSRKVTTDAARYDASQKRAVGDLRSRLSRTQDPEQRSVLEQQIKDLSGSSTKSYGDMVTAAGHYRMLAQNLRKDAESAFDDGERNDMLARARYYEQEADAILQTTTDRRLGGKPKATSGPNSGNQNLGTASTSKYKEGDIVSLKSGGKGKVVNVNGKLMVQPL